MSGTERGRPTRPTKTCMQTQLSRRTGFFVMRRLPHDLPDDGVSGYRRCRKCGRDIYVEVSMTCRSLRLEASR